MVSISKIKLNSTTYEFKESKDPVVMKTYESPQFPKSYMYGMHSFELNEAGPSGYKPVGIVHSETSGVVFPFNVVFQKVMGKYRLRIGLLIPVESIILVTKHSPLRL